MKPIATIWFSRQKSCCDKRGRKTHAGDSRGRFSPLFLSICRLIRHHERPQQRRDRGECLDLIFVRKEGEFRGI